MHAAGLYGEGVVVTSFEKPGRLAWASSSLNVSCRLEWASSPEGPWHRTWSNQYMVVTMPSNVVDVAMCYRVVCERPDPHFADITAGQSLALLVHRLQDTEFVVIDVRTEGEYGPGHIVGALNIDFYGPTFSADLDALNKDKAYLIYCASGNRSGQTHDTMLGLGFHEVYNMLGGMGIS